MTSTESPENIGQESALDDNAAPTTGSEPDTSSEPASDPAVSEEALTEAVEADGADSGQTVLDGPALENEEMHKATDDLRSSEQKSAQAKEIADDFVAKTEPDRQGEPARPSNG